MSDRTTPLAAGNIGSGATPAAARNRVWRRVKGPAGFAVIGLAVVWIALPQLPAAWGIRFGRPYLVFFSLALVGAALFFVLLNWGPIRRPESALATFASILSVYVATVAGMVAFGYWYYPQFETPAAASRTEAGEAAAEKRGREIFLDPAFSCFACHTIEALGIRGGQRGPDLSAAGKQAEMRKPGMSADDYLRESIVNPWACLTPLPASGLVECQAAADPAKTYPQLMPPGFKERMTERQLDDLVAFLKNLRGAGALDGKHN